MDEGTHNAFMRALPASQWLTTLAVILTAATSRQEPIHTHRARPPQPRRPLHTSYGRGADWTEDLLEGRSERLRDVTRMGIRAFEELHRELIQRGLQDGRHIRSRERLLIFLYIVSNGQS